MEDIKTKHIEAESITLKHPEGKKTITLSAMKNGVGIWLGNQDKMICIFDVDGQFGFAFHNSKNPQNGHEFAVFLSDEGPMLQIVEKDGSLIHKKIADLIK